jgi:hypothetical protein
LTVTVRASSVNGEVARVVRYREHQRPRVVGLGDDLGDLQFKDVVTEWLVGNRLGQGPSLPFVATRTCYRKADSYRYQPQEYPARHKSERVLVSGVSPLSKSGAGGKPK